MQRTVNFRTTIGFGAAFVIFAGIAVTTHVSVRRALADDQLVVHTYRVLEKLQNVLVTLVAIALLLALSYIPALTIRF